MKSLCLALACALVVPQLVAPQRADARDNPVYTDPGELPLLRAKDNTPLPLEHTDVKAEITGFVARVTVAQTYTNPAKDPLEAIYVFPLPENSAVDDMRMRIGDREIRAEIQKRADARQTYETAKQAGQTAALLEQERPNVFTQSVANIAPGARIDVVVSYVQTLTYDAGTYEFVFPMVVGPRYMPGSPLPQSSGTGRSPDTTQVPDASRISPPYFGAGERNGHDISIDVVARPGFPINNYEVPTHQVIGETLADGALHVKLSPHDKLPNRDFVLHFNVAGKQAQVALLTHGDGSDGEFALIVQPPALDVDKLVGKREVIFVVDVSGSMSGVPLAMCKDAMRDALRKLRPLDTFNVLVFASRTGQAFAQPLPANDVNVLAGMQYVDGLEAGGGTEMADAVAAALSPSVEHDRHRYVFFLTDGYVGNEEAIIASAAHLVAQQKQSGARARVFGFGVGSSVNRMLIDGLGKAGEGAAVYVTTREDPVNSVNTFFRIIDAPVIEDLKIDWGTAKVSDVYPKVLPDLFASRPTIIHGHFSGKADTTVTVRGTANGKALAVSTKASFTKNDGNEALGSLWARAKVESLERDLWNGPDAQVIEQITQVGLSHRLVTAYTSFVAVDTASKVDGKLRTVNQPAYAPEGVDMSMAAGDGSAAGHGQLMAPPKSGKATHGVYNKQSYGYGGGPSGLVGAPAATAPAPLAPASETDRAATRRDGMRTEDREKSKNTDAKKTEAKDDEDKATSGALLVGTGLDKEAVRSAIAVKQAELTRILAEVGFTGTLKLRWFVTSEGAVIQFKVVDGKLSTDATSKLSTLFASMKFPAAAQGAARVEYTLTR